MMALFTGKGDDGTTTTFGCDQRLSKSSKIAEALGVMDEANSYLGLCKTLARREDARFGEQSLADIVHEMQNNCFTIQAELAGADYKIPQEKVKELEELINKIEDELPEIKSFFISGANELSARFDFARTLIRRAERRAVAVHEEGVQELSKDTLAYLNRASSALYALARYVAQSSGAEEESPNYQ